MPPHLAKFLFERSLLGPFLSAWSVGFCVVVGGRVYLSEAGERYLEGLGT